MVDLTTGIVDYGDAPDIYVTGPARVCRLSPTLLRMSYYVNRVTNEGIERRVVLHILRDLDAMRFDLGLLHQALAAVTTEKPPYRDLKADAH